MTEDQDISKYGFFIVIVRHANGKKSLAHGWCECEQCDNAQFTTEKAAIDACNKWNELVDDAEYYYKYVSWNKYD